MRRSDSTRERLLRFHELPAFIDPRKRTSFGFRLFGVVLISCLLSGRSAAKCDTGNPVFELELVSVTTSAGDRADKEVPRWLPSGSIQWRVDYGEFNGAVSGPLDFDVLERR